MPLDPRARKAFLDALADLPSVTKACKLARINRAQLYKMRREDEDFRREWDTAADVGVSALEDIVIDRAKRGSDRLLMFYLKATRPEKYRENQRDKDEVLGDPPPLTIRLAR